MQLFLIMSTPTGCIIFNNFGYSISIEMVGKKEVHLNRKRPPAGRVWEDSRLPWLCAKFEMWIIYV